MFITKTLSRKKKRTHCSQTYFAFLLNGVVLVFLLLNIWFFQKSGTSMQERESRFLFSQQQQCNTDDSWEYSRTMPMWMKYYIFWHRKQLEEINESNWNVRQYYVLHCLVKEPIACGGASDRLQQVPYVLRHAYNSNRIFFIKWEKPGSLEEFLEPPDLGLDWRLPKWLDDKLPWNEIHQSGGILSGKVGPAGGMTHGGDEYDAVKDPRDAPYHIMCRDAWLACFRPVQRIQRIINGTLRQLQLVPGAYIGVHIRAKYLDDLSKETELIHNAVSCAGQLRPGKIIFVSSDSNRVLTEATSFHGLQHESLHSTNSVVKTRMNVSEPKHLDNGDNFFCTSCTSVSAAADYYDTFVDLYLLALSSCVVAGRGGYGVWASRMSRNSSCLVFHSEQDPGSNNPYFSEAVRCY